MKSSETKTMDAKSSTDVDPTVYVVDDDPAMRNSLAAMVRSMKLSFQAFASGDEFLAAYQGEPGCILLDLRLPGLQGLEVLAEIERLPVSAPVIMLTGHGDVPAAVRAMKLGAFDFLEKPYGSAELRENIKAALNTDSRAREARASKEHIHQALANLSDNERKVMALIATGTPNKQIATELGLSLRTIHLRRVAILTKLGVKSKAELTRIYVTTQEMAGAV